MLVQEAVGERDLASLASPSVVFMSTDKNSELKLSWHSSNSQGLLNDRLVLHVYLKRHQTRCFSKPVYNHLSEKNTKTQFTQEMFLLGPCKASMRSFFFFFLNVAQWNKWMRSVWTAPKVLHEQISFSKPYFQPKSKWSGDLEKQCQ